MSKIIEQIKEIDKSLSFIQFKSETDLQYSDQYLDIVHQLLERRSELMVSRDLESSKNPESSPEGGTKPLSVCCSAPMEDSASRSVQAIGGLVRSYKTKVCSKCKKPSKTFESTKQIEEARSENKVEALWRADGKKFSRNKDGSYSMDGSPDDPKPRYSYTRLIESGVFGHEPPPESS